MLQNGRCQNDCRSCPIATQLIRRVSYSLHQIDSNVLEMRFSGNVFDNRDAILGYSGHARFILYGDIPSLIIQLLDRVTLWQAFPTILRQLIRFRELRFQT